MSYSLPSPFRLSSRSLLTAFCLTLSLLSLTGLDPAVAQEQRLRTLTVSGRGVVAVPTTQTHVRLGVEVQGKTAQEVQQEVARRSSAVVALLRSRNVEKLQTAGISLNPVYNYQNNQQILTGYSGSNIVSFRLNTQQAGTILDDAVQAGATRIDGIGFIAGDNELAIAQQQALREATQEAQKQADTVLSALNLTRQEITGIQIHSSNMPIPRPMLRSAGVADAATTPVEGGEQQVEASVTLQISY